MTKKPCCLSQIQGVGTDILEIERFKQSFSRYGERFLERLFTEKERAYCNQYKDPVPRYAVRFSAKEAVVKALGIGFGKEISFQDIEILNNPQGKPEVFLSQRTQEHFDNPQFFLSLSHSKEYATATVLALKSTPI